MFEDAELIHRYTRADALRDGVLGTLGLTLGIFSGLSEFFL